MKTLFKPLLGLTVLATLVFGVAACSTDTQDSGLTSDQTIAYSTYMAGAFMADTQTTDGTASNADVAFLDSHTETQLQFEHELGEVNKQFNRLKVFLDNGMENPFPVNQDLDVDGDWDITMGYTVDDKDYTILLNEDSEGNLTGTLILNGVEYDVEGSRESESETETENEETTTESEQEIFLKTLDQENSDNFMEISIETESEDEEYEFEMSLEGVINGEEKEMSIEFNIENDETSIEMESSNGNAYSFSRETDDNNDIDYEFEYTVNEVEGEVEVTVTTNDAGEEIYRYRIEEEGMEKEIDVDDDEDGEDTTS